MLNNFILKVVVLPVLCLSFSSMFDWWCQPTHKSFFQLCTIKNLNCCQYEYLFSPIFNYSVMLQSPHIGNNSRFLAASRLPSCHHQALGEILGNWLTCIVNGFWPPGAYIFNDVYLSWAKACSINTTEYNKTDGLTVSRDHAFGNCLFIYQHVTSYLFIYSLSREASPPPLLFPLFYLLSSIQQ